MHGTRPDIVFVDLLAPGMSGEQVAADMRLDPALREVPVVVASAGQAGGTPALLETSLELQLERPLGLARGARLMKEMLDALDPTDGGAQRAGPEVRTPPGHGKARPGN